MNFQDYTIFALVNGEEQLIIEKTDKNTFEKAVKWCKEKGFKITRTYTPKDSMDFNSLFIKAINI
jgi:hypothetical protein